jgi:PAS domain S-box-containing protein
MRKERDYSANIVETNPALIVVLNDLGKIIRFNKACEFLTGYKATEVMGQEFAQLPFFGENMQAFIKPQKNHISYPSRFETSIIARDESCHIIEWSGAKVVNVDGSIEWVITGIDFTERKRAEDALRQSHEQLRNLSQHLQSVREEERTRISRELHDELGQYLSILKLDVQWLENLSSNNNGGSSNKKIQSMKKNIDTTINQVRNISRELRPSILDNFGLVAAIEWQAEDFEEKCGIHCQVFTPKDELKVDQNIATAIFRVFQESLTNVLRHAKATEVEVNFHQNDGNLVLQVKDNGIGITEKQIMNSRSLGLLGMKERITHLSGDFHISGHPGGGTELHVTIPIGDKQK